MAVGEEARRSIGTPDHNLFIAACIGSATLLAGVLHVLTPFNHDEAWIVLSAGRLLDGGKFGQAVIDVNPPLAWWIAAVPVWISRQIGIRADVAATIFTALMAAGSLFAVDRLLAFRKTAWPERLAVVSIATIVSLLTPGYDFGQREHWMVLLALPYIVARSRESDGQSTSVPAAAAIGVAAGLGFCLKPYFLFVPAALEIWVLTRSRWKLTWPSVEIVGVALTGLTYIGLVLLLAPEYLDRVVPDAARSYWTYQSTPLEVLRAAAGQLAAGAAAALLAFVAHRKGERIPALSQAFAVAGSASLLGAVVQMKGWPYHFLPCIRFFMLSAAALLVPAMRTEGRRTRAAVAIVLAVVLVSTPTSEMIENLKGTGTRERVDRLSAIFRQYAHDNKAVFGLITSPRDVLPAAVAASARWAAPFCCLYLLPAVVRADEVPVANRGAMRVAGMNEVATALEAIETEKPSVIVVDSSDRKLGYADRKFDYLRWLAAHTHFAGVIAHYREVEPIGPFRVFVRSQINAGN